jgi:hypothetical protein
MSKTVEVPESYVEISRPDCEGGWYDGPTVAYNQTGKGAPVIQLHSDTTQILDKPEAVKCYTKNNNLAILPCNPGEWNAYAVYGTEVCRFSAGWLKHELENGEPEYAVYELEKDEELWVVDFDNPLKVIE